MNITTTTTKNEADSQIEQTSGYQWGRAIRGGGVGGTNCWEVSRMDYTCGILPIFYNNCKWKITCKNCIKMFDFFLIFIFTLFYFTILYWFCHTLT